MCSQIQPTWVILCQLVSHHPTFVIEEVILIASRNSGGKNRKINHFCLPCATGTTYRNFKFYRLSSTHARLVDASPESCTFDFVVIISVALHGPAYELVTSTKLGTQLWDITKLWYLSPCQVFMWSFWQGVHVSRKPLCCLLSCGVLI